jgi:uncharacterized protein YdeI (YjbR/CyaY-like superfamily)
MKKTYPKNVAEWRSWLVSNHDLESEIWLVYYRKGTGRETIAYEESVQQALCFGWVDSIIKKIDDVSYARKFTPRKEDSNWSPSNIQRVGKMIASGQMTPHGMRLVEAAKRSGRWDQPVKKPDMDFDMPPEFRQALQQNPEAQKTFDGLAPTYQKQYITWIAIAKRDQTRARRIAESIQLLQCGQKLGLR